MADNTNPQSGGTIDLRTMQDTSGTQTAATTTTDATTQASTTATTSTPVATSTSGDDGKTLFEKFEIPETVRSKYPELIPLILQTESMNDDERQYWFQILPIMTDEQVSKLREILDNEKKQLADLDTEYEQELKKINDKHVAEWKTFEAEEKRKKLQAAESKAHAEESKTQEDLLNKLQEI